MFSVCLLSDALSQHLRSYLDFSYPGHGVSLHGCSSKAQLLLLTLNEVTPPDLEHGVALLNPPVPMQPLLLGSGLLLFTTTSGLGWGVASPSHHQEVTREHFMQRWAR